MHDVSKESEQLDIFLFRLNTNLDDLETTGPLVNFLPSKLTETLSIGIYLLQVFVYLSKRKFFGWL